MGENRNAHKEPNSLIWSYGRRIMDSIFWNSTYGTNPALKIEM